MRIAILGASGFIGRHLADALRRRRDEVVTSSIRDLDAAALACAGADVVVNLAGAPVAGRRWTAAYKDEIRRSRVDKTAELIRRLGALDRKPNAFVTASAIGYYGTDEERTFVEADGPGNDFLAGVCRDWEGAALEAQALGMRVAQIRTALVLGDGGALAKLLPPFRLGVGGIVGSGRQWWSWIHVDDVVGIYTLAIDGAAGPLNASAPEPVRNRDFTAALGRALQRPTPFPVPAFALALAFGEGSTVLTKGQRVLPERTQALGYVFRHPELNEALAGVV